MGWAKYQEDNLELLYDCKYMQDTPQYKPETQAVRHGSTARSVYTVEKKTELDVFYDKLLCCKDCGRQFRYSASAQKVYKEKGWAPPQRCKCCRETNNVSQILQPAF